MKRMRWRALFLLLLKLMASLPAGAVMPSPAPGAVPALYELGGMLVLVNQGHRITKAYVPQDLVLPAVATRKESLKENILLRGEAARALEAMFKAARFEGNHILYAASGYRSFGIQQILFNSKVEEVGSAEKARWRVAAPGTSEHQLGLSVDIQAPSQLNLNPAFGSTEEGKWAGENAHRFGFILRYRTDWRAITGVSDEPWHFRYVGIAHATAMHQLDIPLETYVEYARQLPDYVLSGGSHVLLAGLIDELMNGTRPAQLDALDKAGEGERDAALRAATAPYLEPGQSYEQALWYAYPTPKPTAEPWADREEEVSLPSTPGGS